MRSLHTPVPEMVTSMTNTDGKQHRSILQKIARRAMLERGFVPDFPPQALAELDGIHGLAMQRAGASRRADPTEADRARSPDRRRQRAD
jgi:hypothetical protein